MYNKYTLDNGIRVVTEEIPYVNSISIGVWVKSGSRYENEKNNGVSHFIEHMLFKGTKKRSAKQIAEEIEDLGGQINAFTGKEATCFYVKLLDEHFNVGIDVLSDMILNSKFNEEDIEKEKSVILEEINMYEDSPEDLVIDLLSKATWGDDSLSFPILGEKETIALLKREDIIDYFHKHYVTQNMVIAAAGNFNEEALLTVLNDKFGQWEGDKSGEQNLSTPEINRNILVKNKDIEQIHVALTLDGIELGSDKLYPLLAINNYFGGGTSSKLFQTFREEKGYVYTIYSFPSPYKNKGSFNVYFALNDQYMDEALNLLYIEIKKILECKMNSREIMKAKEQLKGNYILGLESVSSRMFSLGKSEIMLNKVYEPKDVLDKIDNINDDDVNNLIDNIFKKGVLTVSAVGKNINGEKLRYILGGSNENIH